MMEQNAIYTVQYERTIPSGRDAGYTETETYMTSDLKALARTVRNNPRAKVFVSTQLDIAEVIELARIGNQMAEDEKRKQELEDIEKKIAELQKRKEELAGENLADKFL